MVGAALGTSAYQVLFSASESDADLPDQDYGSVPTKNLSHVRIDPSITELKE